MDLPEEFYDILIPIALLAVAIGIVSYVTKRSRHLKSKANRRNRAK